MLDGLRVLHLQKAHGIGGSELHILDLCEGLRGLGARPEILWLEAPGHPLDALLALGRERGLDAARLPIRADLDPGLPARLRSDRGQHRPDLLHLHLIHASLYGALAARGVGVRALVATRHRDEPYQRWPWFRLAARLGDRACRRVIAPSSWVADYAARWDGIPREKLRVVRHGIDLSRFAPSPEHRTALRHRERSRLGLSPDATAIVCVARLHPTKDHETLLRAFAQLRPPAPPPFLLLVGTGPQEAALRARVRDLLGETEAAAHVRFEGERPDVEALLAAAEIAVVSTHREGFCLAALEAMAAGLPLVATRVPALEEIVRHEETGLLVEPGSASSMAQALERLLTEPGLRRALGERAGREAATYTIERMARATAEVYLEALGGPPAPR